MCQQQKTKVVLLTVLLLLITLVFHITKEQKKETCIINTFQRSIIETKFRKNELGTLHRRWITHTLINSLATFSFRGFEVPKISRHFEKLRTHKIWNILRGETFLSVNLLASAYVLFYRFKYIKFFQEQSLSNFRILFFPNNCFGEFLFLPKFL